MDTETRQRAAKRLLVNYLGAAWKAAGLQWDSDNVVEVEAIIGILFDEIEDRFTPVVVTKRSDARINGPDWDEA